jgi:hypothetical protein
MYNAKTFTWAYLPPDKGELPSLEEILDPMVKSFIEKFEEEPKVLFLHPDRLKGLEDTSILGMEIIPNKRLQPHDYAMAVHKEDIFGDNWRKWSSED